MCTVWMEGTVWFAFQNELVVEKGQITTLLKDICTESKQFEGT